MIGWSFPSNGGGQIHGIADAGIQTFTGKEISSLAREICQNSLDAVDDENFPVTVEFHIHQIFTRDIPERVTYRQFLNMCKNFWQTNPQATKFIDEALQKISEYTSSVLRISDFNTTGLAEPFNPRARTGWNTLTKIDGGATKTGDAAGSFGIGKNAPFANSYLRLVFYRTLNLDGERAAQGISRLPSFRKNANEIAAGVGYYGDPNGNMPVITILQLDNIYQRNEVGTDIFVYGFKCQNYWIDNIFIALIENFLVTIYNKKLILRVHEKYTLDESNLEKEIQTYNEKVSFRKHAEYYEILSDTKGKVQTFTETLRGGVIKLRILRDDNRDLSRKILVVRKTGMKLFEYTAHELGISGMIKFTAILELEGDVLNAFFREMETPAHDKWEPSRHSDPKKARDLIRKIRTFIKEKVTSLSDSTDVETIDVQVESPIFDDEAVDDGSKIGISEGAEETESLDPNKSFEETADPDNDPPRIVEVDGTKNKTKRAPGETGKGNSIINRKSKRNGGKNGKPPTGHEDPNGDGTVTTSTPDDNGNRTPVGCRKIRIMKIQDTAKKYRMILKIDSDISHGQIEISAVSETDSQNKLFVESVKNFNGVDNAKASNGEIIFDEDDDFQTDTDIEIIFELAEEKNYALRAKVYEN